MDLFILGILYKKQNQKKKREREEEKETNMTLVTVFSLNSFTEKYKA